MIKNKPSLCDTFDIMIEIIRKTSRSSRPEVFCKKGVLKNFAKFTGKHLCQNLFFNKVAGLRPATLLKNRLWHRYFPVNFAKSLRKSFFIEQLWWLLLTKPLKKSFPMRYCMKLVHMSTKNESKGILTFCPTYWTIGAESCSFALHNHDEPMDF